MTETVEFPAFPAFVRKAVAPVRPAAHLSGLQTFADMFCGIGGFHLAAASLGMECVFACDIDDEARRAYEYNFGIQPSGDICRIKAENVPDHDLFCAGFPCQPFSIIGKREGLADTRGALFFEIERILRVKRPRAVVLENVKQFSTNDGGRTLRRVLNSLESMGYATDWRVLNALNFGLPQKRERTIIIGVLDGFDVFPWPRGKAERKPLSEILEAKPDQRHYVSDRIRRGRHEKHASAHKPAIWHENKAGNISSYPYSCALRAGASYNYLLVDGERRLTPREMLRLQGFPDSFESVCNDSQTRKQAGNSVPVPMITAVMREIINVCKAAAPAGKRAFA